MNIFICPSNYLGWASLPWAYTERNHKNRIFIHPDTVPGKTIELYNLGLTLVHEVGHSFGLGHFGKELEKKSH